MDKTNYLELRGSEGIRNPRVFASCFAKAMPS